LPLLDSNAIFIIVKRLGERAIRTLKGGTTLDLAAYELGNAIWKDCRLIGSISPEEAADRVEKTARLLEIIEKRRTETPEELRDTMGLATELGITFYDAAYLHHARSHPPLVTEDRQLMEKGAQVGIEAITVKQLLER
jgi:predicted nucleic acid-binding protein